VSWVERVGDGDNLSRATEEMVNRDASELRQCLTSTCRLATCLVRVQTLRSAIAPHLLFEDHHKRATMSYEPDSPTSSRSSSASPPPGLDDALEDAPRAAFTSSLAGALGSGGPGAAGGKRRLPGGGNAAATRDTKTRRREDPGARRLAERVFGEAGKKEKDELVDVKLAEQLRRGTSFKVICRIIELMGALGCSDFGDPFDDSFIKSVN
jgi:hypothetical protein